MYQEVDRALSDSEVLDLRSKLNELHDPVIQEIDTVGNQKKCVYRYAVSAASVAILLCFGIFSLSLNSNNIIEKYYQPYAMSSFTRSADVTIDQILQEALIKYDNQQYREAVILFEKVLDSDSELIPAQLYAGISYMEIKKYSQAETSFNKVINHNDNLFIEQAEWYIGFCYLMTERKEKAIKQFSKIAAEDGFYRDKAKNILKKVI